ncbi:MAG TPA: type 2 isopentenyl-diphosphate Delta-isomerase [Nevskiaceae bacterium]|nr:type 2 isopentenyl-diphosphate Delta-isomerase [Nevskiaceae bacterium]
MTAERKRDHLKICLGEEVEVGSAGFESYFFVHNALPEINFEKIDTSVRFLGKKLQAPILISSMTGGTKQAGLINHHLAQAAQKVGVAMAVGSQRVAIKNSRLISSFQVRDVAPDVLLFANLGAVQLNYGFGIRECRQAVEMIEADGLILHLNPVQETIQPEGNTNFSGLLSKIEKITQSLEMPVIVKEVGAGISETVARKLFGAGVKIVDVAGWGGTNWALIESLRGKDKEMGEAFANWGIPTSEAIKQCTQIKGLTVIGSGGIRNGIQMAKAFALGADLVGMALPLLKPATQSAAAVKKKLQSLVFQLKTTMFCLGVKNIGELKKVELIVKI